MKTVFSNSMVAHEWANGNRAYIRNSNKSIYAQDGAIYSYGSHFVLGAFTDKGLLLNSDSYGNTTNRHKSEVWRALHRHQQYISVPKLNDTLLRDFKALQKVCIDDAADSLEKSRKARQNRPYLLEAARDMFATAEKLGAMNLPKVDSYSTKADVDAILLTLKRDEYLLNAKSKLDRAAEVLQGAQRAATSYGSEDYWTNAQSIVQQTRECATALEHATSFYKQAATKAPRKLAGIRKDATALQNKYLPLANAEIAAERAKRLAGLARETFRALATYRNNRRDFYCHAAGRLEEMMIGASGEEITQYGKLCDRIKSIQSAEYLKQSIVEMQSAFDANRPFSGHSSINEKLRYLKIEYFSGQIRKLAEKLAAQARVREAELIERNRQAIDEWRAGNGRADWHWPTMARVKGVNVETSRGAIVPLTHAARLVRIAERVAARGGASWANGAGPMVGSFRATSIGADFSAVIGCHEFSAEESMRIIEAIRLTDAYKAPIDTAEILES